ncbi:putative heat shock protein 70-like protein [Eutypa lata UCREL1]|uniref:Putative heat shock protein 70-like protein n=1 Tax=Eutypa lata (strain UCR-EL1) TaxID=1287681 RepID=M7T1C9_EUTLA|nr:putative heat shock protein 70-like protein [Eutypa lata UCREL1]
MLAISPVEKRIEESEKRPALVKSLKEALSQTDVFIETIKQKIAEAEAFSSSTPDPSSTVTQAPSADGDFDELEDDTTTSTTSTATVEDRGPVPPLYTVDDLKEITDLSKSTLEWLEEKLAEQEKLPSTANPILLVKDITERTKKLEKVGMDLAMKTAKNFEKDQKKKKSSSSKKSTKTKKPSGTGKADSADAEPTIDFKDAENFIKFGADGKAPTAEELEEMIKKLTRDKDTADRKHDEL